MIKFKGCLCLLLILVLLNGNQINASKESEEEHHHHEHDLDHDHHHHDHVEEPPHFKYSREANEKYSKRQETDHAPEVKPIRQLKEVWFGAIGSTLLISVVPYLVLIFIPINNPHEHQSSLKVLLSFASGGLLGDAFLHLIPHALIAQQELEHAHHGHSHHGHSHGHGHENHSHGHESHSHDMSVGLCVLSGILVFLMIEKFVRIVKGTHHHHGHAHNHTSHDELDDEQDDSNDLIDEDKNDKLINENDEGEKETEKTGNQKKVRFDDNLEIIHYEKLSNDEIKVAGYLNLAADFAHNFTDGLAIGASYLAGNSIGVVTTLTILFHEVPHEIGDFAILIQSGCSKSKAMTLQLITALGALSGTILSLAAEGLSNTTSSWILPFTAGGFIYIATVSVIPELLEGSSLKQSFLEICALVVGVLSMVLIAQYE